MEKKIQAVVPKHLCDFLQPGKSGEVLLVSSSGIYLRFGEQILLLCDENWGALPIGIGMEDFCGSVSVLQPRQGQTVSIREDQLRFPSGDVCLIPNLTQSGAGGDGIPHISLIRQAAEELAALHKERGISMLVRPLILGQALEDTLKINPHCRYAQPYFSNLIEAFRENDGLNVERCVGKLLGLGLGLTPSADDVFLGMLYVFRSLPQKCPETVVLFRECIARSCEKSTGQISAAYLKAMMTDAPFGRMESVYRGLCGEEPLNIQQLIQIGSSSGSEMLLGMLIALRICGYDVSQEELQ